MTLDMAPIGTLTLTQAKHHHTRSIPTCSTPSRVSVHTCHHGRRACSAWHWHVLVLRYACMHAPSALVAASHTLASCCLLLHSTSAAEPSEPQSCARVTP